MECMDNKTAGTPPSWGTPLFTIHSIFQRDGDSQWLAKMYPLLSGYLNFWLKNRTDSGGYQIAMCSWYSKVPVVLCIHKIMHCALCMVY